MTETIQNSGFKHRRWVIMTLFIIAMIVLMWRAIDLQVLSNTFLREHGDARAVRVVTIPAHRGMVTDRNGEPLAVSTPVNSIWATPRKVLQSENNLEELAGFLEVTDEKLHAVLSERIGRDFVYLKRHIDPALSNRILRLDIPGIAMEKEFKRFYPTGEVAAHLLGFTNIDDVGQEGLELAFNDWLQGTPGSKRVLKDRLGRIIENIESIDIPQPGKKLVLSIDRRIQYLAYRELKSAVNKFRARGGTLVMLDAKTGEVMAMVGQPSYNPNNRNDLKSDFFRNRAVTDVFEPGSTIKPFTIAAGLKSGLYTPQTSIDTRPGFFKVGKHTIRDTHNYGVIDVASVIKKSSNVGASKIALSLEPSVFRQTLVDVGFGIGTASGYPGEADGHLGPAYGWSEIELATIAFGYGLSVTALQLASAYQVLAADGVRYPISFIKTQKTVAGEQVMDPVITKQVRRMLAAVVSSEGTGKRAAVNGFSVAGKTGTVHKAVSGGYSEDRYISLFAGIVPVEDPRLVMVVVIDEPQGNQYFGGQVAAPVFSNVMAGALRLLNINPDDLPETQSHIVAGQVN